MSGYTLHFEWSEDGPVGDTRAHDLEVDSLEMAKLKAAMLYAGASFQRIPPRAYRIEGPDGDPVYRFPERQLAAQ
jgi:hypothetical protein